MSIDKLYFIVKFRLHSIRQYLRFKAISVVDSKLLPIKQKLVSMAPVLTKNAH